MSGADDALELLRQWAEQERHALIRKHECARAAVAAGASLRAVAEAAGVSHQTIANWTTSDP